MMYVLDFKTPQIMHSFKGIIVVGKQNWEDIITEYPRLSQKFFRPVILQPGRCLIHKKFKI